MAYALVFAYEKPINRIKIFPFYTIYNWLQGFFPAPVHVGFKEFDKELLLYIIKMPRPEIFSSKNKIGKKRTLKKWISALKNNNIEHYLLEKPLKEYLNGEWLLEGQGCLDKSLRSNIHLLFSMEPLKEIEMQTMTITLSGVRREFVRSELMSLLRDFKLVNVIGSANEFKDMWDEFMTETGVPVCITDDFGVLSRSHVWISFDDTDVSHPFGGIRIDTFSKKIIYPECKKQYRIGYTYKQKLLKKLGIKLVKKFNNQVLPEFLMQMLIKKKNITISEAEEFLGVKITILSVESLGLCS